MQVLYNNIVFESLGQMARAFIAKFATGVSIVTLECSIKRLF